MGCVSVSMVCMLHIKHSTRGMSTVQACVCGLCHGLFLRKHGVRVRFPNHGVCFLTHGYTNWLHC